MKRLNLTFFMELGAALSPLAEIPPAEPSEDDFTTFRVLLIRAMRPLATLLNDEQIPLAIPASRPEAANLRKLFEDSNKQSALSRGDMWQVYWCADRLRTLLHGELAVQSVYHIWPKRAFDINLLIEKATSLFSKDVQAWMSDDERYNISQAGKCVAFETPTAAGFHLIRAAESVIRRYYKVVVGTEPALKMRNWGTYIKFLKTCGGDAKVIHALEQIKDLHRNPVIHPDVALTLEEAISLIGITESIISAIHSDMLAREQQSAPATNHLSRLTLGTAAKRIV
jgi:hypothetical protein